MGSIVDGINQQIYEAMKARDEIKLSTLRMLSSAFNYEKIAQQHELSEEEELEVIRREAKKRTDAIDALRQAQGKSTSSGTNMDDRIAKEQKELAILKAYLPAEMPEAELSKIIDETVKEVKATDASEVGKVIGAVMGKVKGHADGKKVAELVKQKFS